MIHDVLFLLIGLALVVVGAECLVDGASDIARKFGLSEFLIGLTIVGIGTSLPELVVSLAGALRDSADIAIGNVVGSNIFNVLLILGVTALIRPIGMTSDNKRRDIPLNIFATALLIVLGMRYSLFGIGKGDTVTMAIGGLFLLLFAAYMVVSFKKGKTAAPQNGGEEEQAKGRSLFVAILMAIGGLAGLIFGGDLFVDNARAIAHEAGLSEKFIAITILAGGTSMPELVTCVVAAAKKKGALALGNIIGSNISNILLIIGASALVSPSPLSMSHITIVDLLVLTVSTMVLLTSAWTGRNNRIGRLDATSFLLIFIAYMAYLFKTI